MHISMFTSFLVFISSCIISESAILGMKLRMFIDTTYSINYSIICFIELNTSCPMLCFASKEVKKGSWLQQDLVRPPRRGSEV